MRSLLTLLRGTGLGFMLSYFPVLGGGVGSFRWFINNLFSCPLVSFLRSFFSIFSIPILYGLVFKPFLGRVAISLFISILYGLVLKPFLGKVAVFISICIYYSHISLSPFECTSLKFR